MFLWYKYFLSVYNIQTVGWVCHTLTTKVVNDALTRKRMMILNTFNGCWSRHLIFDVLDSCIITTGYDHCGGISCPLEIIKRTSIRT